MGNRPSLPAGKALSYCPKKVRDLYRVVSRIGDERVFLPVEIDMCILLGYSNFDAYLAARVLFGSVIPPTLP